MGQKQQLASDGPHAHTPVACIFGVFVCVCVCLKKKRDEHLFNVKFALPIYIDSELAKI